MENEEKSIKVTFYLKNDIECPICRTLVKREELLTGRGRLIASHVSKELRRIYEPSKVYGKINPLIYPITVCPQCYYAVLNDDFTKIKPDGIEKAKVNTHKRQDTINRLFKKIDFTQKRDLYTGAASYILAIECYDYFDKWFSPTIKKAICAIRAGWILSDLEVENPLENYGEIENLFFKKALQYYIEVLYKQEKGLESFDGIKNIGPDTDFNYGYDGILYLIGALTLKLSYLQKDSKEKIENLEKSKKIVSKMFGFGRMSKEKPSVILDLARDLYDELGTVIEELTQKLEGTLPPPPTTPPPPTPQ